MAEYVKCNVCGHQNGEFLFKNKDRFYGCPGKFNVYRCPQCGLIYLNPRPQDMTIYYPSSYEPYAIQPQKDYYQFLFQNLCHAYYQKHRTIIDQIKALCYQILYPAIPLKYQGKILDLGCGTGAFLYHLKKQGWDVYGLEWSQRAVQFAREKLKLKNVREGKIEELKYPPEFFDVITMQHVIEHLEDPKAILKKIHQILRPQGLLLITTPNAAALNFQLFKQYWFDLETPRHLHLFNPFNSQKLAHTTGFSIQKTHYEISTCHFLRSLGYRFQSNYENILYKIASLPLALLLAVLKKSDVVTYYLQKVSHKERKNFLIDKNYME